MAKFIKRSERDLTQQPTTDETVTAEAGQNYDDISDHIKSLIDEYSDTREESDGFSDIVTEMPDTDSDVIQYFNDPDEYKYAKEKRAAEIKRGRAGIFRRSAGIDPVPQENDSVEHRILQVKTEHSVPGNEPEDSKFADSVAGTKVLDLPSMPSDPAEPDGKTRKFIHAAPTEEEPVSTPPETTGFVPDEKTAKRRRAASFVNNFSNDPILMRYPEYSSEDKADEIKQFLKKEKKISLIKLIICGSALALSALFSLIPVLMSIGDKVKTLHIFGGNGLAYGIVLLVLLLLGTLPLINDFLGGFAVLSKKKANSDSALLLMWIAVYLQNIFLLFFPDRIYTQCSLYNTAALALTAMVYVSRIASVTRTTAGFRLLASGKPICGIRPIEDDHRSERVGQGILESDAKIAYRADSSFMDKYINASMTDDPSVGICTRLLPVSMGIALITAVITAIAAKNICAGISAFTAVIIVTVPISVTFALRWLLDSFNRKLNPEGGVVPGYSAAAGFTANDAVIFDAAELYGTDSMNVFGAKTFGDFELYDTILLAAAMFIHSDSPLGGVFKEVIAGKTDLLPKVESLLYEDKQGLSAWINNEKVLAGTRDMMIHHNIEVPALSLEDKYTKGIPDRKIVYLSVEGKMAAIFVVSYSINPEITKQLKYLVKHGYSVLLRSTDPNINDAFVERQFKLTEDTVKVINPEASEYFKMCKNEEIKLLKPGIFSTGNVLSSLNVMAVSVMLKNALDITTPFAVISAVLGLLIVILLTIFSGTAAVSGFILFLLQALWAVIGCFACRILAKK